jgi:hypothetical protein
MASFLGVDGLRKLTFDWIWKLQSEKKVKMEKNKSFSVYIGN